MRQQGARIHAGSEAVVWRDTLCLAKYRECVRDAIVRLEWGRNPKCPRVSKAEERNAREAELRGTCLPKQRGERQGEALRVRVVQP
jgi:hypothetical protein